MASREDDSGGVQADKRNLDRFPPDFAFQLTQKEFRGLRSQTVTSKRGGRRYPPYAFTEQGVAMLSSVLRSERAVLVNVGIMRAFVRLRKMLATNAQLAGKLEALEQRYDAHFRVVFDAIRQLMAEPERGTRRHRCLSPDCPCACGRRGRIDAGGEPASQERVGGFCPTLRDGRRDREWTQIVKNV
ncbi:MAG: ORF6N domain-containing protein [Deltaproteobacteria bacterium]|nr:ORF6N domain-containing protein [Deltaproteobacteria bacterium]